MITAAFGEQSIEFSAVQFANPSCIARPIVSQRRRHPVPTPGMWMCI